MGLKFRKQLKKESPHATNKMSRWNFVALFLSCLILASCNLGDKHITNTTQQFGGDKNDPGGYEGSGGTGDGGGGQGIQCSEATKVDQFRSKLFVRDIFEGINVAKLDMKVGPSNVATDSQTLSDDEAQFLVETLRHHFGHAIHNLEFGSVEFWHQFVKKISFISNGAKLVPSQDANSPIAPPAGCKIVQIAFWSESFEDSTGTLYIDLDLWRKLDSLNRVALLAHEYFFKEARQAGYTNSDMVRGKIAKLFSKGGLPRTLRFEVSKNTNTPEVLPSNVKAYKFCKGKVGGDPTSDLQLYITENSRLQIARLRSKQITISSLQTNDNLGSVRVSEGFDLIYAMTQFPGNSTPNEQDLNFALRESTRLSDDSDPKSWLAYVAEQLSRLDGSLWAGEITTAKHNIKLEIENPVVRSEKVNDQKNTTAVTPVSMIFAIVQELMKGRPPAQPTGPSGAVAGGMISTGDDIIFMEMKSGRSRYGERFELPRPISEEVLQSETLRAFAVLNAETMEFQTKGTYSKEFPRWTATIHALAKKIVAERHLDWYLSRLEPYPNLLFKAHANILSKEEYLFLNKGYSEVISLHSSPSQETEFTTRNAKFIASSADKTAEFLLSCEDAGRVYNAKLPKASIWSNLPKRKGEIKFSFQAGDLRNSQDASASIKQMLSEVTQPPMPENYLDGEVPTVSFEGRDSEMFSLRIAATKEVTVFPCTDLNPSIFKVTSDNVEPAAVNSCYIINFLEDSSYFMIIKNSDFEFTGDNSLGPPQIVQQKVFRVRAITPPTKRSKDFVW